VLRGWCAYFRHGVWKQTFSYLRAFTWRRVVCWLRRKHPKANWRWLKRHYLPGWWPTHGDTTLLNPAGVAVTRYRYRGQRIATPWEAGEVAHATRPHASNVSKPWSPSEHRHARGEPDAWQRARPVRRAAARRSTAERLKRRLAANPYTRLAYVEVLPDEKATTCISFLTRALRFYRATASRSSG
jgi:Group II intron, maturase-specific domain